MHQSEFRTIRLSDSEIEVEEVAEGHIWTFRVSDASTGERILSSGLQLSPDHIRVDQLGGRARHFAEHEAFAAGIIDRSTMP